MRGVEGDWAGEWVVIVVSEGRCGEGSGSPTSTTSLHRNNLHSPRNHLKHIHHADHHHDCFRHLLCRRRRPPCSRGERCPPVHGVRPNGVCSKGPGQRCGGYRWEYGRCGEGTVCMCGVCTGCSPFDGSCYSNAPIC
ncbi:hypothetical protein Pmani_010670 [Petrolisthes manimaculis]|uniref:Uncharacterized protein n=1 Tax=Petrolisthes manimaculis TaxID=1843537 RepID=A0AAE1UFA7_9EUCA|nr:hypothetical protein Pmani_010670 [Petrolisthes manimaculis]